MVARAGSVGRLLPVGVHRFTVVVPRRPGRDPTVPGGGDRDGGLLEAVGVRRRHPRLLLDPRPPRHGPTRRCVVPRRARRGAPSRRGRGRDAAARAGGGPTPSASSSCEPAATASRRRDRPHPSPGQARAPRPRRFFRAHQAWHTAHASDAEGWGIAAYAGRRPELALDLAAQDGCFSLVTRGPEADRFEVVTSIARGPRRHRPHDLARRLRDGGGRGHHDHDHRGRLPARPRRPPRPRRPRGLRRPRVAAARPKGAGAQRYPRDSLPGSRRADATTPDRSPW